MAHKQRIICLWGAFVCFVYLSACANSPPSKLRLSDLGTRYWQGTYYLSVEGQPFSIQCDVNPAYRHLNEVFVRYQGQDATLLFYRDEDQEKIKDIKQKCLKKSFGR